MTWLDRQFDDVIDTDGRAWDRRRLHGAAYTAVIRKLERLMAENDYEQFDITHALVYEPGRCEKNLHVYCGCGIHQAWCPCMYESVES